MVLHWIRTAIFEVSELFVDIHIGVGLEGPHLCLDFIQKLAMFSRCFRVLQGVGWKNIRMYNQSALVEHDMIMQLHN